MRIKNEGPAGWAVHPGEILREEFLEPMGISAYRLAVELRVSPPTVNDIVREKRGITPEMAARLAKYFGTSEQFWLNLQDAFAVHQVKEKLHKELRAIKPFAAAAARWQISSDGTVKKVDGTRELREGVQSGSRRNQNPVE